MTGAGRFLPVALAVCAAAIYSSAAAASVKLAPPEEGVYHSAHPDFGINDDLATAESVREFESLARKKIVWAYLSWNWDGGIIFPSDSCRSLHGEGVVPLVGIMPWSLLEQNAPEPVYTLDRILRGDFDAELSRCADDVRALGFPIMMEFGPEVNGSWFPWNGAWNGRDADDYGERGEPDGPERFRDAYRHVAEIFKKRGAADVTWVFHIAAAGSPEPLKEKWNEPGRYYPGDEWIDWIGASVYGRLRAGYAVPFGDIMKNLYDVMCALSPSKPLALLELGVSEGDGKAAWIAAAMSAAASGLYPRIKAVSWWNKALRQDGSRSALEINSSEASLEAYREGVKNFAGAAVWSDE
jgi:beta-mannanase